MNIVRTHAAARATRSLDFNFEFHWAATFALGVLVVPLFILLRLPLAVEWSRLLTIYWIGLSLHSVALATLLVIIGFPLRDTLAPVWAHYKAQKARFALLAGFTAIMFWEFGFMSGLVLLVLASVLAEIVDRTRGDLTAIGRFSAPLLVPSVYLFLGLVMVFAYNDVIATVRRPSAYDWLYLKSDAYLLLGSSVSALAHKYLREIPAAGYWAEVLYYGMFNQIGAGLIVVAVCRGWKEASRYVGTLLTAYYLGLILFLLWPSMGPFYTCATHFSDFPQSLRTYGAQLGMATKVHMLATNRSLIRVDTDYFIAFPCLHIAQPLVVAWYLRKWKRMLAFLIAYDVVLIPAILLLEWHYVADIFGGLAVGVLAIFLNDRRSRTSLEHPVRTGDAVPAVTNA
jgi:hypothetical protein